MKRDLNNRLIFGVCSGIANWLAVDPVWVRLLFALLSLFGFGSPILIYLILAILMPAE